VLLACLSLATEAAAQQSLQTTFLPGNQAILQNYSSEFPPLGPEFSSVRGRLMVSRAEQLLRDVPASPEAFELLVYLERPREAADLLRRIIQTNPAAMARAFELIWSSGVLRGPDLDSGTDPLPELLAQGRSRLAALPQEEAVRAERAIIVLETRRPGAAPNPQRAEALRALAVRHPGTAIAQEIEVDLIMESTSSREAWIRPLEEVAARYPGTTAAARALFEKAFQYSSNLNRRNDDPTERFLEVLSIATELRSGRYPDCEWVARAPWLGIELSLREPVFAPGNVDRLLDGYLRFVRRYFTLPEGSEQASGINAMFANQLLSLFDRRGDGTSGVERALTDLEAVDRPRAQDARVRFYVDRLLRETGPQRQTLQQKARDAINVLSGDGLYRRRALATLASLEFMQGNLPGARGAFESYLSSYPDTSWSWVAAIRAGQSAHLMGDLSAAIEAYRTAATRYAEFGVPRALGYAFAARANEELSRFDEAASDYSRALEQWGDLRRSVRMEGYRWSVIPSAWTMVDVQGLTLLARVAELRAAASTAGGAIVEQGRSLLNAGRRQEALDVLERFLRDQPDSPIAGEALSVVHRARLAAALELVGSGKGVALGLDALEPLTKEPWDEHVAIAKIVKATLTLGDSRERADALMSEALTEWQQRRRTTSTRALPAAVVRDVAEIRERVLYGEPASATWRSSFEWQFAAPHFSVIDTGVAVTLGDAAPVVETVLPINAGGNVLPFDSDHMTALTKAMNAVIAVIGRQPNGLIAPEMLTFLKIHLPVDLGWFGVINSFRSIPAVLSVRFMDAERTRAQVGIRAFSSGGVLLMEKSASEWRVTGVGPTYVN
jgi:tetratricopeptide (TPR) repeat protein